VVAERDERGPIALENMEGGNISPLLHDRPLSSSGLGLPVASGGFSGASPSPMVKEGVGGGPKKVTTSWVSVVGV